MILRRKALAESVVGVGRRVENLKTAVAVGAIDRYVVDPKEAVKDADLVVLATPVDTYERHLKDWASCFAGVRDDDRMSAGTQRDNRREPLWRRLTFGCSRS